MDEKERPALGLHCSYTSTTNSRTQGLCCMLQEGLQRCFACPVAMLHVIILSHNWARSMVRFVGLQRIVKTSLSHSSAFTGKEPLIPRESRLMLMTGKVAAGYMV